LRQSGEWSGSEDANEKTALAGGLSWILGLDIPEGTPGGILEIILPHEPR